MRPLLLVALALALACSRQRLALAPELASSAEDALAVHTTRGAAGNVLEGRSRGTLGFGPHLADWERDVTRVSRAAPGPGAHCGTAGSFAFALRAQPARRVQCEERMEGSSRLGERGARAIVDDQVEHHLQCRFEGGALTLSEAGSPGREALRPRGSAQVQGVQLALEPAFPPGGDEGSAWGFTLREAGRAVAAVQTQEPREVWLAPALSGRTRSAVVLVAAALLIADPGLVRCADLGR